jgi:hypothetical protein
VHVPRLRAGPGKQYTCARLHALHKREPHRGVRQVPIAMDANRRTGCIGNGTRRRPDANAVRLDESAFSAIVHRLQYLTLL